MGLRLGRRIARRLSDGKRATIGFIALSISKRWMVYLDPASAVALCRHETSPSKICRMAQCSHRHNRHDFQRQGSEPLGRGVAHPSGTRAT